MLKQIRPALVTVSYTHLDVYKRQGKEMRFGIPLSALFAVVTTAASCGAVNAMHGSFTALGGMIPLINMELGEVIVGGVGAGFYGIVPVSYTHLDVYKRQPHG